MSVPVPKKESKYTHIEVVLSCFYFFIFLLALLISGGHLLLYLLLRIYEVVAYQTVKLSLRNLLCFKYFISVL